jgi:hypothetical protein
VNNVKKNNLTRGAIALLLLASTAAGADQQYPAADFQPEVVYQDSDYIAKIVQQQLQLRQLLLRLQMPRQLRKLIQNTQLQISSPKFCFMILITNPLNL